MKATLFICHVTGDNGVKKGLLVVSWERSQAVSAVEIFLINFSRTRKKDTFSYSIFQDGFNAL